jgi:hypothetical protein
LTFGLKQLVAEEPENIPRDTNAYQSFPKKDQVIGDSTKKDKTIGENIFLLDTNPKPFTYKS